MHLFIASLGLFSALCSLLASLYVILFAWSGIWLRSRPSHTAVLANQHLRFLIFIPAHNEAHGIRDTIESALAMNYPPECYGVITIADNCDDATAEVAARCGSQVWTRSDPLNRGKGHALSWAFARAVNQPFDLAAVIDADTAIDPEFLARMNLAALSAGTKLDKTVFQGRYEFAPTSFESNWFETFTIASRAAENSFVYCPRSAVGMVNLLQGNGFCVPRQVLRDVPFESTSIVEDADYAIELALRHVQVRYVDTARVLSRMTCTIKDAAPQRLRWATGIFQLMLRSIPRLVFNGIVQRRWQLVEAAVNLMLTSRLLIVYLTCCAVAVGVFQLRAPIGIHILEVVLASALLQSAYLWLMFRKAAEKAFSMRGLLFMPAYIGMIGLSQVAAFVGIRGKRWTRTVR